MKAIEGWATFLVFVGVAIFAVFNATNVAALANGIVTNSTALVSGIATIKNPNS